MADATTRSGDVKRGSSCWGWDGTVQWSNGPYFGANLQWPLKNSQRLHCQQQFSRESLNSFIRNGVLGTRTKYAILTNLILTSPFLQRRGPLHPSRCVARCQAFATAPLEALGNHPVDGPEGLTGLHQGSFAAILGGGASPTDCLSCFIIVSARSNIFYLFHI